MSHKKSKREENRCFDYNGDDEGDGKNTNKFQQQQKYHKEEDQNNQEQHRNTNNCCTKTKTKK